MEPILEIQHLSISFHQYEKGFVQRELPVIRDLSLTLEPGEVTGVLGASGSGKSLLAHALLDLLPYNSRREGTILFQGEPLTSQRIRKLRGKEIVLVPQGVTYLDPLMKVGPQLRKGRRDRGAREKVRSALARYGLKEAAADLYPFQLSGGMARRVLMASAVMDSPRLVIADEPTPGLDAKAASRLLGHFRELAVEGAAVLFITHDLELALAVAHRVAVFYAGETVEIARASDFPEGRLRHPFTQALWDALPQGAFRAIPGAQPYPGEVKGGCPFLTRCPHPGNGCGRGELSLVPWNEGMVRCLYPHGEVMA